MATELAKAYVQIIPSAKGISGNLEKEIGGADIGGRSANAFAGAFKKVLLAAGIGLAVKKVVGDAFQQGGELQQNLGGTEAVFGEFAKNIQDTAATAYKNMGMSASDYMATANKMGSLFQGSGIEQQKALDMTSAAMQRAADVASVMGIDMGMAMESIAGAAKGNFTMMDNLGVAMNATTLQAYALEKGVNFEWRTATNAQKAELAMQMFMERTSQYAGNFARESEDTWTGSMGAVKAAYKNMMANIMLGEDLTPSITALAETIKTFAFKNLFPALVNIAKGLPVAFGTVLAEAGPEFLNRAFNLIQNFSDGLSTSVPVLMEKANQMIVDLISFLQSKGPEFLNRGSDIVANMVNGILSNIPQIVTGAGTMVTNFVVGIAEMLPSVLQAGANLILKVAHGIIENFPTIVSAAANTIANYLNTMGSKMPEIVRQGIEIIGKLGVGLIKAIPSLVAKIPQISNSIIKAIMSVKWLEIGKNIIAGIAKGLKSAGKMLWDAVKSVLGDFKEKVLSFFGIHSPSRWGEYVGEMISLGFPRGVEGHLQPFEHAMNELVDVASSPIETILTKRIVDGHGGEKSTEESSKLKEIIEVLRALAEKDNREELKIYLKDREVVRALKEMGVVFA